MEMTRKEIEALHDEIVRLTEELNAKCAQYKNAVRDNVYPRAAWYGLKVGKEVKVRINGKEEECVFNGLRENRHGLYLEFIKQSKSDEVRFETMFNQRHPMALNVIDGDIVIVDGKEFLYEDILWG